MKWKKFFYKQLCLREGLTLCKAPSCDVCSDYALCFGAEER
jgi:nitrogen fixation protein NifQ